jgi:hypothetical protein
VNGFFGRGELFKPRQIVAQNFAVKKQQSGKRLILRRSRNLIFNGEMRQKRFNLRRAHLIRIYDVMKTDIMAYPINVSFLSFVTVMPHPHQRPHTFK